MRLAPLALLSAAACTHADASPPPREPVETVSPEPVWATSSASGDLQVGEATWYSARAGRRTASGEPFDPSRMTAAHRTLPFGTVVDVTCRETGETVRVRITDRGPFGHASRIIDLSRGAAERLGIIRRGVAHVEVRVVQRP